MTTDNIPPRLVNAVLYAVAVTILINMELSPQEKNYRISERADEAIQKHGSIDKAITFLKAELAGWEDAWGMYSSECLGHGITCNRLLINWLERKKSHCV